MDLDAIIHFHALFSPACFFSTTLLNLVRQKWQLILLN